MSNIDQKWVIKSLKSLYEKIIIQENIDLKNLGTAIKILELIGKDLGMFESNICNNVEDIEAISFNIKKKR